MGDDSFADTEAPSSEARHESQTQPSASTAWGRGLLTAALDCIIISDHEGRILEFNPAAERTFGYRREDVVGKTMAEVIIPASLRESHEQAIRRYVETGRSTILNKTLELAARRADGTEFPAELTVVRIDLPGHPTFVGYLRDLTASKRVEEATHANLQIQSALNSILQVSLAPLTLTEQLEQILDILFSIPWVNLESRGAVFLVEGTQRALVMKAQRGLSDAVRTACAKVPFGRCLCGQAASKRELVFVDCLDDRHETRYEGMLQHGHYCVPMFSDDCLYGVLTIYLKVGHHRGKEEQLLLTSVANITAGIIQRKQAEESLAHSEERFQLAIRATDAGIWDWDLPTNEVYFSPQWKSMLGYAEDEVTNGFTEWETRVHPDDRERAMAAVEEYLAGRSAEYELEHRLRHKDGTYRWILSRGAAVHDEQGKAYRMVGSHLDITDRKQAEQDWARHNAELIAAYEIQQLLLPHTSPSVPGFEMDGASFPADFAAGDHFDFLQMPGGRVGVVIGDVAGHGFASALVMASTHAHIRSLAEYCDQIDDIVSGANVALSKEVASNKFVTLLFAQLAPKSRTISYVNAGHPTGYIVDGSGAVKTRLESGAMPLGVMPDTVFPIAGPFPLDSGDLVLLITDGFLEAACPEGELFGTERVLQIVRENRGRSPREILDVLRDAVRQFSQREEPRDDLTGVLIKVGTEGTAVQ